MKLYQPLRRKLHVSWLVAWFAASLIAGIILAYWIHGNFFTNWEWLIVAAALLFIALTKRVAAMVVLAVLAGLLLGLWRGGQERSATQGYQNYVGQTIVLSGTVADDITHKNGQAGLKLRSVKIDRQRLGGEVWAGINGTSALKRDDLVTLYGKLQPGFGTFAAGMSHATLLQAKRQSGADLPRAVRDKFAGGLRKAVPEPEATLGLGYLTGQHNDLSTTLTKQLQLVGLIHLVIAGGYNVTILVRFARRKFMRFSKYLALLGASSILLVLTLTAGFTAPMARTAVVTGLSLATWYYGRRIHPLVLLSVAAAVTALASPSFAWGDVGWYLTFIAYGGLIVLGPMLKQLFWKNKSAGTLKQIFTDTLSVQIVTMPLLAFAFQQYSIYGLPANLLVLPLMPFTMLASVLAGVAGMFLPAAIAHVIGWPAYGLLNYTDRITQWLAAAQGANVSANLAAPALALAYGIIGAFIYLMWRKTRFDFRTENVVA